MTLSLPTTAGFPFLGAIPRITRHGLLDVMLADWRRHGDVFGLHLGPRHVAVVTHPDHFRHVLKTRRADYAKHGSYDILRPLVGDGLLTANGEAWAKKRRLANPAFYRMNVERLLPQMSAATLRAVERWRTRPDPMAPLDMGVEMTRLTLEVVAATLFDIDLTTGADRSREAFADALHRMSTRGNQGMPPPMWLPTPNNLLLRRSLRLLERVIHEIIEKGRAEAEPKPTLIHQLLHAVDEVTGEAHGPGELRDEVMTMVFAGHETMATSTMWGWNLLSDRDDVFDALRDESLRVLGDREPTPDDLPRLVYTRRVLDEILRLRNPVWSMGRDAVAADEIGGHRIEPGTGVMPLLYALHRHPEFWEDPERFDPDRFLPARSTGRHPFQYLPFSGGPRYCIGNNLALAEGTVILSMIARRVRLRMVDPAPVKPLAEITIRPHRPMLMRPTYLR